MIFIQSPNRKNFKKYGKIIEYPSKELKGKVGPAPIFKAFTILEVILVIIIVGVLTSLALPKLFSMIEYARSAEAMSTIASIRASLERCFLRHGDQCYGGGYCSGEWRLDIEYPGDAPNAHFDYFTANYYSNGKKGYYIWALRNGMDGGKPKNGIRLIYNADTNRLVICGIGVYAPISRTPCSDADWPSSSWCP